ncbi:hypothetical protein [Rickettsiella endosymbiont of Dermanyssus gallinae]|uniref:hypothetical protein n=1 Tax=Rickettsiella endosymbiont of Dermanyssus gallinae TaxID=2856608 RepID=UPI001C529850|nr:hypothetical protein [Rickettsiella endosymbiont of Dermanyssus gallinae]
MSKLKIKDIVVVALCEPSNPIGEAPGRYDMYQKMTPMDRVDMVDRLFIGIGNLIEQAEIDHLKSRGKGDDVDRNYITRISTNEFFSILANH